ncbi:MAG TPA: hypothetical protein VIW01_05350 [Dehalococcoidia bacterium]
MSKLSQKIRAAGRAEPAPLGFASAAARAPQDSLLCGVRLQDPAKAAGAASRGADFVILEDVARSKVKGISKIEASVGVAGDFDADDLEALVKAGVDFVVLAGPGAGAAPLADESVGRVIALDGDLDDTHLRLLGDLGLDAIVIAAPKAPLTVERLLSVRRLSALARTPLLANATAEIDEKSLELLRDSGVAGIVLEDAGKLAALKKRIAALPARGRRKENHTDALIPAQATAGHDHGEDDDFDDFDD